MPFRAPIRSNLQMAMRVSPGSAPLARAPDNELYDRGADLVEAAMAIRRVAASPEAGRAVPAVLGCIESALKELVMASAALDQAMAEVASRAPGCPDRRTDRVERMRRGYVNLQEALFDAHAAATAGERRQPGARSHPKAQNGGAHA